MAEPGWARPKKPTRGFAALDNKAMPGLPSSNWPRIQITAGPVGVLNAATVSSGDLTYTVTFYDFDSPAAAAAFYNDPPAPMISFINGALGYAPLQGPTGVSGQSRGVDLRSCTGEGSGPKLVPSGQCSNGSASFSNGVATIVQVGAVVMMVGYLSNNLPLSAKPAELRQNVKVAASGLRLLKSVGI
jgi:hypothetical protein